MMTQISAGELLSGSSPLLAPCSGFTVRGGAGPGGPPAGSAPGLGTSCALIPALQSTPERGERGERERERERERGGGEGEREGRERGEKGERGERGRERRERESERERGEREKEGEKKGGHTKFKLEASIAKISFGINGKKKTIQLE